MKRLRISIFIIFCMLCSFGQTTRQETRELINSERIAFITKELSLTSEEAQKLWPVMNESEQKRENLRKERNKLRKNIENNPTKVSESDYDEVLLFESQFHSKEAMIFSERQKKLRKIFTSKRILELYRAEEEFKKWLIKNVRNSK